MKKSTRIISMLLVLIMVMGLLPLSLFAVGENTAVSSDITLDAVPEALNGKGGIADKTTLDKILRSGYVSEEDVILFTDFDEKTAGKAKGETKTQQSDKNADFFGSENTKINVKGDSGSPEWIQVANGDMALTFNDGVAISSNNKDVYFDVINRGLASDGAEPNKDLPADRSFVFQMDVKRGETFMNCAGFISAIERTSGGPNTVRLVGLGSDGRLYVSGDSSITLGYLSKDVFTTIAVYVDPGESGVDGRYWVYINGVLTSEEGYAFGYNKSAPFRLNAFRIYQVHFTMNSDNTADSGDAELSDNAITFDNVQSYYVADSFKPEYYVGLDNVGNRFVQDEDGIYYYHNGGILKNGTYDVDGFDYSFDAQGRLLTKKLTSAVDLYGILDVISGSGDTVNKAVGGNGNPTMLARSRSVLKDGFTYEWFSNHATRNLQLSTSVLDWRDYDAIEFTAYTDKVEQLFTFMQLVNKTSKSSDGKSSYYGRNVNFGDTAVKAYKNNSTSYKTLAAGFGVEGWANIALNLSGFSQNRNSTWDDISNIAFNTAGWDLDYRFAENSSTLIVNAKDVSVHFAGFNLVNYSVVEDINDVMTVVDGKLVPTFGLVGYKISDGLEFYYDPFTQKLVKNVTKWVEEVEMAYNFDENGVGTPVNGFAVIGGASYYFTEGVMTTEDFELEGKTYKVNGDGSIIGVYGEDYADWTPYAPYETWEHDSSVTYIGAIDFQNYAGKVYDNRGGSNSLSITSGTSKLNCVLKSTGARMVTENGGNVYMEFGNYYDSVDPYLSYQFNNAAKTAVVFDFDLKLGESWNAVSSLFTPISEKDSSVSGSDRMFGTAMYINSQGYIYKAGADGNNLFKLSSEEFTRISVALDPATRTYSIYANGVKIHTVTDYSSSASVNIKEFRMFQFNVRNDVSSLCIDNFYVYEGTAPQKTVDAELRNGVVEENGTTRFYADGVMKSGVQEGVYYNPVNGVAVAPENMNGTYAKKLYENGELVTEVGFKEINGKTYYVTNTAGDVHEGNIYQVDGNLYFFGIDGAMKVAIAAVVEELVSVQDFVIGASDRLEIAYDSTGAHVKFKNGIVHETRYLFDAPQNLITKRYLEIDVYVPEEYNEVDFQIIYGSTERYYGVTKSETSYSLNNEVVYKVDLEAELAARKCNLADETTDKKKFTYANGNITIEDIIKKVIDADGNPTGEYYVYKNWNYQYFPKTKLDQMTPGWNTIRVDIPSAGEAILKNVDFIQFNFAGWEMNTTRDWNTNGKDSTRYPDSDKCDFRFSALRVGKIGANIDYATIANEGFAEDGSYVDANGEKLTGIQVIDGVWYVFDGNGVCEGKLNGIHKVEYYEQTDDGYVLKLENRVFVEGVMQIAKPDATDGKLVVEADDKIYIADKDGLLVKNDVIQNAEDKYFFIDEEGEGTVANGFEADDKYYVDGYRGNGELTVDEETEETMYFKDGDGQSAHVVKKDGMILYGEDGKQVGKIEGPVCITLKITNPGEAEKVLEFYHTYGKGFKYTPAELAGYTAVITVNGQAADAIELDSVTENTEIVITYGANA